MPFLLLILALAWGIAVQRPADIVKWSAQGPATAVRAGSVVKLELTAKIEEGWKLYAVTQPKGGPVPLGINLAKGTTFELVRKSIVSPLPKVEKDENFGLDTQYYEKEAVFTVPVATGKTVEAGTHAVPFDITFQACGANICLRPFTQRLEVKISVTK